MASSSINGEKHEVFISFRGKDVRFGFLSHTHKALVDKKIHTFVDYQLERGEEITPSLLEIIERSAISVVIFSENYACSPWCLDELVKILECKKTKGQKVIPVFYLVKPEDVQELTGSFGKAIADHKQDINLSHKVENWCQALMETSTLSGFDSHNFKSESELIEEIIKNIQERLDYLFMNDCSYNDGLVGIYSRVENVKLLLCCEDAHVVGIWGPGGIGKTTIAQKLFDQICDEFESYCFVANVREKFEKCPDAIHNELLAKLLPKDASNIGNSTMSSSSIKRRLLRMKVLIVLDDVSDFDQIKSIIHTHYGSSSRILVTSRDKQLLINVDAKIYKVEKLNESEALQLFCLHAFGQNIPEKEFAKLSKGAVKCAGGLPLALQVFGCNLRSKSMEEWEDELENLKVTPNDKVLKILKRSYDGLSKDEKDIFLDIACFFKGKQRDYVESIFAKDLPDRATKVSGSKIGISRLVDKSLISISSTNCVDMHDLIQQMGWETEYEEQMLKKRRRVWKPNEIIQLLTKEKGSDATKGISLDLSKIKDINLSPKAFKKMDNLKYLIFYNPLYDREIRIYLPEGLEFLSEELRCLCWYGYPLKSLPKIFSAENLVELRMPFSDLEELWDGVQNLANLKYIYLAFSKNLIKIPDLSTALNLERLVLDRCKSLVEIPPSLKYLTKLTQLSLNNCTSLSCLPSCLHLIGLKSLQLDGCKELTMFPGIPCYERHSENAIEKVPSSIECQFQLRELDFSRCAKLQCLPDSICNLIYLKELYINGCTNLRELPKDLGNLKFLETLCAIGSGINKLPDSLGDLRKLELLNVGDCVNLCGLPQNLGNLQSLNNLTAYGTGIKELPSFSYNLRKLNLLYLPGCEGLEMPMGNANLRLENFTHLATVNLSFCGLTEFPCSLCFITSLQGLNLGGNNFESIPMCISQLSRLQKLCLRDCQRLKDLPDMIEVFDLTYTYEVDFGNCINLDPSHFSKMMDLILTNGLERNWRWVHQKEEKNWRWWLGLCIPGSEVPRKMMYQNYNGSSLSFSFKPEINVNADYSLNFFACAVIDPQVCEFCNISYVGYYVEITDESGHCIQSEIHTIISYSYSWENARQFLRTKNVLLGYDRFYMRNFFKGNKYTVVFKFYGLEVDNSKPCLHKGRISEAIIKCGVHPAFDFDHQLID